MKIDTLTKIRCHSSRWRYLLVLKLTVRRNVKVLNSGQYHKSDCLLHFHQHRSLRLQLSPMMLKNVVLHHTLDLQFIPNLMCHAAYLDPLSHIHQYTDVEQTYRTHCLSNCPSDPTPKLHTKAYGAAEFDILLQVVQLSTSSTIHWNSELSFSYLSLVLFSHWAWTANCSPIHLLRA